MTDNKVDILSFPPFMHLGCLTWVKTVRPAPKKKVIVGKQKV